VSNWEERAKGEKEKRRKGEREKRRRGEKEKEGFIFRLFKVIFFGFY
jgi:hypothetical protein